MDKSLRKGQAVLFLTKKGFDKKKNKATEVAYQVKKKK